MATPTPQAPGVPTALTTPKEPSSRGRDEEHPQNTEASKNKTGMGQEGLKFFTGHKNTVFLRVLPW